jgi:protein tyrosine/serine phosphatase
LPALLVGPHSFAGQRGLPASEGILNFGKVSNTLFRGAQPDSDGIKNLAHLGVKTIINLRMPDDVWKPEASEAQANGILYTNVPLRGLGRPATGQITNLLALIQSLPGPVFIHCEHGCDRTGTIVACYRIQHDQWTMKDALLEANKYGLSRLERGMRKFIADFAKPPGKTL